MMFGIRSTQYRAFAKQAKARLRRKGKKVPVPSLADKVVYFNDSAVPLSVKLGTGPLKGHD